MQGFNSVFIISQLTGGATMFTVTWQQSAAMGCFCLTGFYGSAQKALT